MADNKINVGNIKLRNRHSSVNSVKEVQGVPVIPVDMTGEAIVDRSSGSSSSQKNIGGPGEQKLFVSHSKAADPTHLITDQHGRVCFVIREGLHLKAVPVESKQGQGLIRHMITRKGGSPNRNTMREFTDEVLGYAEAHSEQCDTYNRIAPCDGGVEIYLCDDQHTRLRVTANRVEVMQEASDTLFCPYSSSLPLPLPAETGSKVALASLLNIKEHDFELMVAWITYTLSRPKVESSKYVFLVLSGDQGSGKSFVSNILTKLIDPSRLGVQAMPSKPKDLALVLQNAHVVVFDNMRNVKASTSDLLCMASTGGVISDRKLYTDGELSTHSLHGAVVFNGIHRFLHQSDLGQRCLSIRLDRIINQKIRSEQDLLAAFSEHHSEIFRYLLDVMARVFHHLKEVKPCKPERMIDFCYWLAAFEKSEGLEEGELQLAYSENLSQTQLDTLMDNTLAATIVEFCAKRGGSKWEGTPTQLHKELSCLVSQRTQYSRDWPHNAIALGKRLTSLKASLYRQGIHLEMSRGRARVIELHIDPRVYPIKD